MLHETKNIKLSQNKPILIAKKLFINKQYFTESLSWYNDKYMTCFFQRSMILLGSSIVLFALFLSVLVMLKANSMSVEKLPIIYSKEYNSDQLITIRKLSQNDHKKPLQHIVAEYLLELYIQYRETYGIFPLQTQINHIKQNGSYILYKDFKEYMNHRNKNSPSFLLQDNGIIHIRILNIEYNSEHKIINGASVLIEKFVEQNGKIIEKTKLKIMINFTLPDLLLVNEGKVLFNFTVNKYEVTKV